MKIIYDTDLKTAKWPWPAMDIGEVAHRALCNDMHMPGIGYINIGDINAWQCDTSGGQNSKQLWLNSLVSAHACLAHTKNTEDNRFVNQGISILKGYFRQYDSGDLIFSKAWKDEHSVANRLFVMTAFILHSVKSTNSNISQLEILYHCHRHAEWLVDKNNYVENNHGVIMDFALVQYAVLIRQLDELLSEKYIDTAFKRLSYMLENTFDDEGYCTENSPYYHFVNYSLFKSVLSFFEYYVAEYDSNFWNKKLEKAETVASLILRPNGTLPLIGDSEYRPSTYFKIPEADSFKGVGYYPDSGLLVVANKDLHFTMRAGGKKYSHRHVDDLSITLWYQGLDFIVDCGRYNYDTSDRIRREIISSRAHSGFYLDSQEQVLFRNFNSPKDMSRFDSFRRIGDDLDFECSASHNLSSNAQVDRKVSYIGKKIDILDSFVSETDESWRFQLVFHPEVEVEFISDGKQIVVRRENSEISIFFDTDDEDTKFSLNQKTANYSESFMKVEKAKLIIAQGVHRSVKLKTSLVFS